MGESLVTPSTPEAAPAAGVAAPPPHAAPAEGARVLVVDDDESNRDALARRLIRRGYAVVTARDGPEALAQLQSGAFDLILLDVMMPGMSGLEVLERVRVTHPPGDLPVIMATAKDQSEDIVRALRLGASDYVTKPLDFPVVLARVQTHLALKRSVGQVKELEGRLRRRNAELESANARLRESAERTRRDLQAAARVQESFLPPPALRAGRIRFAWAFRPCEALAGDSLNVCLLDDSHVGAYVLDVTGHGVAAALSAVAVTRALSPASDPDSLLVQRPEAGGPPRPLPPARVAERLDRKFPFDSPNQQFFTLFYALLDVNSGACRYVSAGHPGAVHQRPGSRGVLLEGSGSLIGLGGGYEDQAIELKPGDRLYLYSDGVTEAMDPDRQLFGKERMLRALERGSAVGLEQSIALLVEEIEAWRGGAAANDDVSILGIEKD